MASLEHAGAPTVLQVADKFRSKHAEPGAYYLHKALCAGAHNDVNSLLDRFNRDGKTCLGRALDDVSFFDQLHLATFAAIRTPVAMPGFLDVDFPTIQKWRTLAETAGREILTARDKASD